MQEDIAIQNNTFIGNIIANMKDRPYLYICIIIGFGIYFWWRANKEVNPVVAATVSAIVAIIFYILFTMFAPTVLVL